jgi:hypothetical protein
MPKNKGQAIKPPMMQSRTSIKTPVSMQETISYVHIIIIAAESVTQSYVLH